jgi:hypothetical protein
MGSKCTIKINTLVSSIQKRLNDAKSSWLTEHLAGDCEACDQRITWLKSLQNGMLTQVVAHSIPDARLASVPTALRGGFANVRQHLFEADSDIRIDVQVEEIERETSIVEGQIMTFGRPARDASSAIVTLYQNGDRLVEDSTSSIGEFAFEDVKPGAYDMTIVIDELCVVVSDVEI